MPVTQEQLVGIIIVAVIDLPLIVISIVLMMGRGSDFIAGINTMSHREKEKYDLPALCRSVGRFTLIAGLLMPTVVLGGICAAIFIAYTVIGAFVLIIRLNPGGMFRRSTLLIRFYSLIIWLIPHDWAAYTTISSSRSARCCGR